MRRLLHSFPASHPFCPCCCFFLYFRALRYVLYLNFKLVRVTSESLRALRLVLVEWCVSFVFRSHCPPFRIFFANVTTLISPPLGFIQSLHPVPFSQSPWFLGIHPIPILLASCFKPSVYISIRCSPSPSCSPRTRTLHRCAVDSYLRYLPACRPTYLPACLPACLPPYLPLHTQRHTSLLSLTTHDPFAVHISSHANAGLAPVLTSLY